MNNNSCINYTYFTGQYIPQTYNDLEDYEWECSNNNLSPTQVEIWENDDDLDMYFAKICPHYQ